MTITTEDGGRTNIYAIEPQMQILEIPMNEQHNVKAALLNGRVAMLGVIAALGAYATTGSIIPGLW